MQNTNDTLTWLEQFPELSGLDQHAIDLLSKYARIVEAPIGTIGYREGAPSGMNLVQRAKSLAVN